MESVKWTPEAAAMAGMSVAEAEAWSAVEMRKYGIGADADPKEVRAALVRMAEDLLDDTVRDFGHEAAMATAAEMAKELGFKAIGKWAAKLRD